MAGSDFNKLQREVKRARARFVLTELELATTFLDLAASAASADRYRRHLHDAEVAERMADRLMQNFCGFTKTRMLI